MSTNNARRTAATTNQKNNGFKAKDITRPIIAGPNRDRLVDAFKYAYDAHSNVAVDFVVPVGYTGPIDDPRSAYIAMAVKRIAITMLEHEDGSGHSFNLKGFITTDPYALNLSYAEYKTYKFTAYYNTKSRTGTMTIHL